jgi:arginase
MKVAIIAVPYDSGSKDLRMGLGPGVLLQHGLPEALRDAGHEVEIEEVNLPSAFPTEIGAAFEINRILSRRVRSLIDEDVFPLVLSGNCNCSIGVFAGAGWNDSGLIWFDGHGDFNTPDSTVTGYLDGMALAIATGRCWRELSSGIPDFHAVAEHDVILIGARDFDQEEKQLLDGSAVALVSSPFIRHTNIVEALKPAIDAIEDRVKKVHVHIDLDVLDPKQVPANHFAPANGLFIGETELALRMIRGRFQISSACIASYEPDVDPDRKGVAATIKLALTILR